MKELSRGLYGVDTVLCLRTARRECSGDYDVDVCGHRGERVKVTVMLTTVVDSVERGSRLLWR